MGTSPDDYIPVSGSHKLFTVDTIYLVKFIQELFLSLNVDWKDKEAIRKFMTSEWLSTVDYKMRVGRVVMLTWSNDWHPIPTFKPFFRTGH